MFTRGSYASAIAAAVGSALFSSVATVFFSELTHTLGALTTLSLVYVCSILIFAVWFALTRRNLKWGAAWRLRRELTLALVTRSLIGSAIYTYGVANTEAIKAIFLTKIEPYFIMAWSFVLLREKIAAAELILLAVHIFGAVLLACGRQITTLAGFEIGDLLIVLGCAVFALGALLCKRVSHELPAIELNFFTTAGAAAGIVPIACMLESTPTRSALLSNAPLILAVVVLHDLVAMTLWFMALKGLKAWLNSALRALGPVLGAPVAYFFFGQWLDAWQWFGAALVVITSVLLSVERRSRL